MDNSDWLELFNVRGSSIEFSTTVETMIELRDKTKVLHTRQLAEQKEEPIKEYERYLDI